MRKPKTLTIFFVGSYKWLWDLISWVLKRIWGHKYYICVSGGLFSTRYSIFTRNIPTGGIEYSYFGIRAMGLLW